mgnify:CR=1 FL=1
MYGRVPAALKFQELPEAHRRLIENGSWTPLAGKIMRGILEPMKDVHVLEQVVTIKSTVHEDTREAMAEALN